MPDGAGPGAESETARVTTMKTRYSRRIYDTYHADTYADRNDLSDEGLARAAAAYKRTFGEFLPADREARILEIGCGVGAFLDCLANMGFRHCRGIDISPDQVDFCHSRGHSDVVCSDGLSFLEAAPESFDAIVMSDVLEHLDKDTALATLDAVARRLAPGGRLLLRVPNLSNPLNVRTRYVDFTHELGFSQESLAQVLRLTGFEILTIHGEFVEHRRLLLRWIFDRLAWWAFKTIYRRTLHLKADIERGKNLVAVATVKDE